MSNVDVDPRVQPPVFGPNAFSGMQGMFGGLRRGFQAGGQALHPYSNRLLLTGMGLLSGRGMGDAMKGLVAGSALDTEDADRTKLNRALKALQDDPESLSNLSPGERNFALNDAETARLALAQRVKPADAPNSWNEYILTTDTPTKEGFNAFLKSRPSGTNITLSQIPAELGGKLALGKLFIDELNVGSGGGLSLRERIKTTFGGDTMSQAKSRAELAAGIGEPTAIWRRAESGKEALVRILTGAGMMNQEANDAIVKNGLRATDSVKAMLDKMDWLEQQLDAVTSGSVGARTGELAKEVTEGANTDSGGGNLTRDENGNLIWSP